MLFCCWIHVICLMVCWWIIVDRHYNNAFYARVGGVSNAELNRLEIELLFLLDFGVVISSRVFESYCLHLERDELVNGPEGMKRIDTALALPSNIGATDVPEIPADNATAKGSNPNSPPDRFEDWPTNCLHRNSRVMKWFQDHSISSSFEYDLVKIYGIWEMSVVRRRCTYEIDHDMRKNELRPSFFVHRAVVSRLNLLVYLKFKHSAESSYVHPSAHFCTSSPVLV